MTENTSSFRCDVGEIDGAILSVHVRNFFCHENLEVKLNKNINFIIGRNGSGKSAILTALVVGLGARAAATNRGTNLQAFVKKGANSATIEIKIKNSSAHAFKPNLYGDVITIIRTINASGGSAYKIKGESGQIISTKHEEVSLICSVHDIQVDNPICVLNQDDARNFHAADSKKKYSLFRKATNMDLIEINYNKALQNCIKAKETLQKKSQSFSELKKEINNLKSKYEMLQSREEVQENLDKLQDEYYWREIADLESNMARMTKIVAKKQAKLEAIMEKRDALKQNDEKHRNSVAELKEKLKEVSSATAVKDAELRTMAGKFQELRAEWREAKQLLVKKREQVRRENDKVRDLAREVTSATSEDTAGKKKVLETEKSTISRQLEEAQARRSTLEHELRQMQAAIAHQQGLVEEAQTSKRTMHNTKSQLNAQLNELNVRGKDSLAVYGRHMVDLVGAVKAAHAKGAFTEMPRGPIGSYLKVRDKKWTAALEHIIGGSINSFCVNTTEDSRKLYSIMSKIYGNDPKPTITTCKFFKKVHDVSENCLRPPRGYHSSLECLQIDDPVVANYLIDMQGVERILMVSTHDEATNFATHESNVPLNCSKIVTLDQSDYYPAPNYRSYGGRNSTSRFLQISTSERKRLLQAEITKLEGDYKGVVAEIEKLNEHTSQLTGQESTLDSRLRKMLNAINYLKGKLSAAENNLRDMEGGHIKVLTEELEQSKQKLTTLQEEEVTLSSTENSLKIKTGELEESLAVLRREKGNEKEALNDEIAQEQIVLERNKAELSSCESAVLEETEKLKNGNEHMQEHQRNIEEKVKAAEALCPRIEDTRDINVIVGELKKLEDKLKNMKSNGPSKQEVAATLLEKQAQHKSTFKVLQKLSTLIELLEKVSKRHLKTAHQIQLLIANRVQYCFQSILKLRGYSGHMEIDNAAGILDIRCTGRDSAAVRVADTTSSLSGGERSYATVAFIMALWDCMELPFYFLDEFDVFMDNVNRKTTMELLIEHAHQNSYRQYVFLTPQDTSSLVATKEIKIHRLADPVRTRHTQA